MMSADEMKAGVERLAEKDRHITALQKTCNVLLEQRRNLDWFNRVASWQRRAGRAIPDRPIARQDEATTSAWLCVTEEFGELRDAITLPTQAKEACDLIVTLLGWLALHGIDARPAMDAVLTANEAKLLPPYVPHESTKVPKGPHYVAPDMTACLEGMIK